MAFKFIVLDGERNPPEPELRRVHVLFTKETDGISASVLNLPGCSSQGDDLASALDNVREALEGCLESYVARGLPVPWRDSSQDDIPPFSEERYFLVREPK